MLAKTLSTVSFLAIVALSFAQSDCGFIQQGDTAVCQGTPLSYEANIPTNSHCLNFDGSSGRLDIPFSDELLMVGKDFSISAWFKTETDEGRQNIISLPSSTWASHGAYCVFIEDGLMRFTVRYSCCPPWYTHLISEPVSVGDWHHVVATADRASGRMRLYLDGELIGTQEWDGEMYQDAEEPLMIGAQYKEDYPGQYFAHFNGEIDDILIWETDLNAAEIQELNSCPWIDLASDELQLEWKMDEGSGLTTAPSDSSSFIAEIIGPVSWTTESAYLQAPLQMQWNTGSQSEVEELEADASTPLTFMLIDNLGNSWVDSRELEVYPTYSIVEEIIVCQGLPHTFADGTQVQDVQEIQSIMLQTVTTYGCDSVYREVIYPEDINVQLSTSDNVLNADGSVGQLQWMRCGRPMVPIEGENQMEFTPTQSGYYAVVASGGGCQDTSACIPILIQPSSIAEFQTEIRSYPSPSDGELFIESDRSFEAWRLIDVQGRELRSEGALSTERIQMTLDFPNGIYLLQLWADKRWSKPHKIVIQR